MLMVFLNINIVDMIVLMTVCMHLQCGWLGLWSQEVRPSARKRVGGWVESGKHGL